MPAGSWSRLRRRRPAQVGGSVDLLLEDDPCPWNAGPRRLVLEGGRGRLEAWGPGEVHLTARGFAVLYAGAGDPALLRRAGLLAGSTGSNGLLQVATVGRRPTLLDYF